MWVDILTHKIRQTKFQIHIHLENIVRDDFSLPRDHNSQHDLRVDLHRALHGTRLQDV